ncbi:sensor histidine kinase [Microbispora rosea]|uniref:sensor histidine kinase n=1 Tax=Microbispora rosea TaxID=58117 RepID=UPI00068D428C|nr:HAMP domain-containing sensor histidine kinase [Microbispora rosea]
MHRHPHTAAGDPSGRARDPHDESQDSLSADAAESVLRQLSTARRELERTADRQRRFLAGASHELLTPLAGLRTQLEVARLHPDETDLAELVDHTLRDVDRLQTVVCDLLTLVKAATMPSQGTRLADLTELVLAEVSTRTPRTPTLLRVIPGVAIHAVEHEIHRLLGNLLDNAQRHARGSVLVEVRQEGAHAEIAVSDDGDGIAEADRERVFEPFIRLDQSRGRGGPGLGLAIAREIVRAHGGTIGVEDAPEGGARFVVRLPLADPLARPDPEGHPRPRSDSPDADRVVSGRRPG